MKVIADFVKQNDRSFLTWAKGVLSLQITSYKFVLFKDSRTGSLVMNFCLPHKLGYGRLSSQRFEYYPYSKSIFFLGLSFLKVFFDRGWLCWLKPWCDDRLLKLCRLYRASVDLEMLSAWVPKFDSNFQISSSTSCRHLYLNQVTKLGLFSFPPSFDSTTF